MQAVVLAGGLGTRMYPESRRVPKSLLEVAGRPFVDWQLERLQRCGIRRVLFCIGHLGEAIREHVADGRRFGLEVAYSEDGPRLLGTAGALRRALPLLAPCFLVTYGDSYLPFDYGLPLLDLVTHPEAMGTMAVFRNAGQWDASNTEVQGDWVVRHEKGRPEAAFEYIDYGATALRREAVAAVPADEPLDLGSVLGRLAARRELRAWRATSRFYEIGSEQGRQDLERELAGSP